ncbi:class I SAM-dependent methyltransferase [Candidatus Daviesbacteria bacterium]|nr:class I SAM-dependent methyltransferase [Candidatus Daviesbacteria bacterium]
MNNKNFYDKKYFKAHDYIDELSAKTIKKILDENQLQKVLDIGCGTGRMVKFLNQKGFDCYGIDSQDEALKKARKINKKGKILKASAIKLPFKNQVFDFVSSLSVIEHLTQKEGRQFLKETRRVLRKNGIIFLITPNYNSPLRYLLGDKWFAYSDPTHLYFYTPESLRNLLEKEGFMNIKTRVKTPYNLKNHWYLPKVCRNLPMPIKNFLTYSIFSSFFAAFRDSFWMIAQKK